MYLRLLHAIFFVQIYDLLVATPSECKTWIIKIFIESSVYQSVDKLETGRKPFVFSYFFQCISGVTPDVLFGFAL